jgi:uncharacterized membrane protein
MIPFKGALWTIGAATAAFLLWWGYGKYGSWQDSRRREWQHSVDSAAVDKASKLEAAARADTIYKAGETVYIRGRDRILTSPGGSTPEVKACFALSDTLKSQCDRRHDADTAALQATARELELWKNKPPPAAARRIQAYGEGLYDVAHMAPVIRVGATARLLGPISLSGAADVSVPPAGQSKVTTRIMLGARIAF